jgi:hypothetical protein
MSEGGGALLGVAAATVHAAWALWALSLTQPAAGSPPLHGQRQARQQGTAY